jgi:hypothetical protein
MPLRRHGLPGGAGRRGQPGAQMRAESERRSDDRDRVAALDVNPNEALAGQTRLRVARVDPGLLRLEVEEQVEPAVAVHVLQVPLPVRLGAVALAGVPWRLKNGSPKPFSSQDGPCWSLSRLPYLDQDRASGNRGVVRTHRSRVSFSSEGAVAGMPPSRPPHCLQHGQGKTR